MYVTYCSDVLKKGCVIPRAQPDADMRAFHATFPNDIRAMSYVPLQGALHPFGQSHAPQEMEKRRAAPKCRPQFHFLMVIQVPDGVVKNMRFLLELKP